MVLGIRVSWKKHRGKSWFGSYDECDNDKPIMGVWGLCQNYCKFMPHVTRTAGIPA